MNGSRSEGETAQESLVASLTESALEVALRHGARGASVDQELELWHALDEVICRPRRRRNRDGLLAEATAAAYGVVLGRGFRGTFVELEMDLWKALRQAIHFKPLTSA